MSLPQWLLITPAKIEEILSNFAKNIFNLNICGRITLPRERSFSPALGEEVIPDHQCKQDACWDQISALVNCSFGDARMMPMPMWLGWGTTTRRFRLRLPAVVAVCLMHAATSAHSPLSTSSSSSPSPSAPRATAGPRCMGEFIPCPSTLDCVLDVAQCGQCTKGQYLCPLPLGHPASASTAGTPVTVGGTDTNGTGTCVGAAAYMTCPGVTGSHLDPSIGTPPVCRGIPSTYVAPMYLGCVGSFQFQLPAVPLHADAVQWCEWCSS